MLGQGLFLLTLGFIMLLMILNHSHLTNSSINIKYMVYITGVFSVLLGSYFITKYILTNGV